MPQFELLGSLMRDLNAEFVSMYYLMLPVFFMLAVAIAWIRSAGGRPDFLDILKRAVVATLLLTAFPDISQAIVSIADGITEKIDKLNNLDTIIRMAKEQTSAYSSGPMRSILMFNDLFMSVLTFLSYFAVYMARYLMIALYQFFWIFFGVTAPLLLLFNLFEGTSHITTNLFKGMIEVASWKIVWSILGAMLAALSYGDIYKTEGGYVTLIVMNFVIAIALLMTPMMVRSIVGGGLQQMSTSIGAATTAIFAAAPGNLMQMGNMIRPGVDAGFKFMKNGFANASDFSGSGNTPPNWTPSRSPSLTSPQIGNSAPSAALPAPKEQ